MSSDPLAMAAAFSLADDELLVAEALFAWFGELDASAKTATARECRAWMLLDTIATGRGETVVELRQQTDSAATEDASR